MLGVVTTDYEGMLREASLRVTRPRVSVLAAVHGHCFGAGLQLALSADIRFATADSQLSVMEARWGLVPDMGLSRSLAGLLRPDVARELLYTARIVTGIQAQALGLVTHVADDPLAAALALASEIETRSPDAVLAGERAGGGVGSSVGAPRCVRMRPMTSA